VSRFDMPYIPTRRQVNAGGADVPTPTARWRQCSCIATKLSRLDASEDTKIVCFCRMQASGLRSQGIVDDRIIEAGVSTSTKTVELDDDWKIFYSGVNLAKFAHAGFGILTISQLAISLDENILCLGWVCMFRLKLFDRSMCLLQAYGPNSSAICSRL